VAYRIHFRVEDLARTRVAQEPMWLFELDLAARAMQDRSQPTRLDAWRRRVRARLPAEARMALAVIPPVGWSFAFPEPMAGGPEELLERARATPRGFLNYSFTGLAERQPMPSWTRQLPDHPALFQQFVDGFVGLHRLLLAPYQSGITELFAADRNARMRQLLAGGVERLLAQANPLWMRWNAPVLEIRMANGIDYDLHLKGQGVLLMPSMFGTRSIVLEAKPQPIVAYPAGQDEPLRRLAMLAPERATRRATPAISALLGRTRAAVLNVIAEHPGCSTKELAAFAGIAPASASEHATVLRQAGLISTARHRNTAVHTPTDLGIALLDSG
jgi:DNA-binding transcriptional ArsR family regulator